MSVTVIKLNRVGVSNPMYVIAENIRFFFEDEEQKGTRIRWTGMMSDFDFHVRESPEEVVKLLENAR